MVRIFYLAGCLGAFLGVLAGAFGAHALKQKLSPDMLAVFEAAVRYQMIHALALLATAWAFSWGSVAWVKATGFLFMSGILLFSGSLYILSLSGIRWWGAVTPFGGLAFLAGWVCLFISIF